jgi:hypothetical protein
MEFSILGCSIPIQIQPSTLNITALLSPYGQEISASESGSHRWIWVQPIHEKKN